MVNWRCIEQIYCRDCAKFFGLLRIYEIYVMCKIASFVDIPVKIRLFHLLSYQKGNSKVWPSINSSYYFVCTLYLTILCPGIRLLTS